MTNLNVKLVNWLENGYLFFNFKKTLVNVATAVFQMQIVIQNAMKKFSNVDIRTG